MTTARAAAMFVVLGVLASARSVASQPKIPPIVERATVFVDDFVRRFSNVVAEERYSQETTYPNRRRELLSDFLLVTPPGLTDWYQFRDVREVDGKPVAGREERLTKMFLESPRNALERASQIVTDAQRYSLADLGSMDNPLLGIGFLQSVYASHFTYTVGSVEKRRGPAVRVVKFDEWQRPTLIRGYQANRDVPQHGRFYIDEPTGRVVRTEVDLDRRALPLQVVTDFVFDESLGTVVPVEMRTPLGVAKYGSFRRFNVQTEEKIR
ncbi:MAG TPA: hypothetical protein VN628_02040 [Vicinamibacterales bacterium]|nr:hypothetical protein [Vicinamibacterales bacterium]